VGACLRVHTCGNDFCRYGRCVAKHKEKFEELNQGIADFSDQLSLGLDVTQILDADQDRKV